MPFDQVLQGSVWLGDGGRWQPVRLPTGYPWLPGYAVSDLAVQIKSIRRDEADKWELMGRRLTVPVVQEPGSACSITNA